jgi:DnaJ-class molecular chaperone
MTLKVTDIVSLIGVYGENTTLGDIFDKVANGRIHKCPKCNGVGYVTTKYYRHFEVFETEDECDLCDGQGYTKEEYTPKMVQDGWEVKK